MIFVSDRLQHKIILFLFIFCFSVVGYAQKPLDKISQTVFDDFETGELYSWEPYPYSQDIGFDALYFTRKSPTFQNSKYALARPVKASDAIELYHGFTKRLNLFTISSTRVKAAIYFQSDRNPEVLEVSLGTMDGRRYFHTIQDPTSNSWIELDIPIADFKMDGQSLGSGEHIQVITIKGSYSMVYYLYTYTILMDNFSINGERQHRFVGVQPSTTDFDMFDVSIINQHYFYGDILSLDTRPEKQSKLTSVKGKLIDSKGKVVQENISFSKKDNGWINESIYRFTEKDALGQWQIILAGQTEKGNEIRWGFRFLMPGKSISDHPRLFFSESELKERLSNEKSSVALRIIDNAIDDLSFMEVDIDSINELEDMTVNNLIGGPYSKTAIGFNAIGMWHNPMRRLGEVIEAGSMRYAFTHDMASGAQAKKALLKLCSFSKLNNNWMLERKFWTYYPVGYTMKSIAYGYDMLYDLLSTGERKMVREFIINQGLKPFYRDMVEMNRMPSNMTNHIAVIVAGYGLAATAIYGDDPDNTILEPFLSGIFTKAKTFIDRTYYEDGSYGEPISGYLDMATRDIVELLASIERNFGINYSTTTNIDNWYKYPLQATFTNDMIQVYGDGDRYYHGLTQEHAEWFVKRTGNPYLYSYIKPYWESGRGGYFGYLWYRDDITPISRETLPVSKVFEAQGMVMRSDWDDSGTVITTRIGPNSNHYHYDQGSFQIMTNKNELITDPGIGHLGYYANLDYLIYNIQSIGQNVLLIDHDPESQEPAHYNNGITALRTWPVMTHSFAGETADASVADLTCVYKNKLSSYTRTLIYTKTGPLFLFDQVKSLSPQGHIYDWLFHVPQNKGNQRSISYSDQQMTIDRPGARLTMDVVSPEIASSVIRDRDDANGGDTLHTSHNFPESYIAMSSQPALSEVNFLAAIFPEAKPTSGNYGPRPKTSRLEEDGWIGASVEKEENVYIGYFKTNPNASKDVGGFTTDGSRFTVSYMGDEVMPQTIYFEGSLFKYKDMTIQSSESVICTFDYTGTKVGIELQTDKATLFSFTAIDKPKLIVLNGNTWKDWKYNPDTNEVSLKMTVGRHELSIK